ncbi:MAG: laminin G domain-containing protein [Kiritimatiellae bacterium]|nr:laminin G domain-containing protein [Kiritimatiellia bacterium]
MAVAASAEVVAWWRFDAIGADQKVVNVANPGTCDGYLTTGSAPSNGIWPADAANMPVVTDALGQAVPRVIDQLTGTVTNSGKALHWNGTAVKGGVVVPYEDAKGLLDLEKFTIEAFVRLPPEAASRTSNQMFPILHFGSDATRGFMFSVWDNSMNKGYLFFRSNNSGWEVWKNHAANMPGLYDGRWHHVAVTFDGNLETKKATMILYVDGSAYAKNANAAWNGWDAVRTSKDALSIGRHLTNSSRTFMGEIAEVRISDAVLGESQFLVPLADRAALVDGDTAVMLTFDTAKASGFGCAAQHLAPCVTGTTTNYVWNARNWNLQNAATNAPLVPCWFSFADIKGRTTYLGDALRPLQDEEALPGASLYGDAFGTAASAEGASIRLSRNGGAWADLVRVPGACGLVADDLTVELFFKTDIADGDTDTLVYSGFLKWCIYKGNLLARTYTKSGHGYSGSGDEITAGKVNDGEWHHAAYVYDKANGAVSLYVDYKRAGAKTITPYLDASADFLVGGQARTDQAFAGNIDDVRITRRALKTWEFLTTHAAGTDRVMDAPLERDYASGVDAEIGPAGVPGTLTASATSGEAVLPEIVKTREGVVTLDGEAGLETRASGHAVRLDGGYVKWPSNRLLDRPDLTVEFFARFDALEPSVNFLRLSYGTEVNGTPVWVLFHNEGNLQLTAYTSTNGNVKVDHRNGRFHAGSEADGKWHHWAMAIAPDADGSNTTFTVYKDYKPYGDAVTVAGLVRHTTTGSNLSVAGTGVAGAFVHGLVNNLRISPGVLAPSEFMRFIPKAGTCIIVR